jgi:hypothetical protein
MVTLNLKNIFFKGKSMKNSNNKSFLSIIVLCSSFAAHSLSAMAPSQAQMAPSQAQQDYAICMAVMETPIDHLPCNNRVDPIYLKAFAVDVPQKIANFQEDPSNVAGYGRPTNFPKAVDLLRAESGDLDIVHENYKAGFYKLIFADCVAFNRRFKAIQATLEVTPQGRQMSQWLQERLNAAAVELVNNSTPFVPQNQSHAPHAQK